MKFDINNIFVNINDIENLLYHQFGLHIKSTDLLFLMNKSVLPSYDYNGNRYVIIYDLFSFFNSHSKKYKFPSIFSKWALYEPIRIDIAPHTFYLPASHDHKKSFSFSSALKNLFDKCSSVSSDNIDLNENCIEYFEGSQIITYSKEISDFVISQLSRVNNIEQVTFDQFSKSASYMGSKKALGGFIVESISSVLPNHGVVVDLMCGSGVVSAAFSNIWRTIASDSQDFCLILAKIHGKGFNLNKAKHLLDKLLPIAKKHYSCLCELVSDAVSKEEQFFYSDHTDILKANYADFVASFPIYSEGGCWGSWNPLFEIEQRKKNYRLEPYCLFTAYFSNIFFGLRQCIEIDSLRYAIDQLFEGEDKIWALGALIATVSSIGTTYGGHFAQPFVKKNKDISLTNFAKILEKRSISVTHEFSVRLLHLSKQSQDQMRPVETVNGPWRKSLVALDDKLKDVPVLVYLDAPYKREEYSRYYHVLETLCLYNYPSCSGLGLMPCPGDRFRSEFFTRTSSRIDKIFTELICEILDRGWMCAWSYSNNGAADIFHVVNNVLHRVNCSVKSYSVPATHKSHRGAKPKSVTEYLIIFS